ncbi:MAG: DUF4351 domain-containing protein [Nevskiaceae bacterium]|nr:DUF4351 domain-containing protein [Nevskiaceae bacterium]
MPSQEHEALLELFRNRPELAAELLREVLGIAVPHYATVRVESADLSQVQPIEFRADQVVLLDDEQGNTVLGIVVEAQLRIDRRKMYSWPVYAANLRARVKCPVCLLVMAANETVANWAMQPIEMGGGNHFKAVVLGPSRIPVITDREQARANPELAVLSALAHGRNKDAALVLRIATAALDAVKDFHDERPALYHQSIAKAMNEAIRQEFLSMDLAKYPFVGEMPLHYIAVGRKEGREEGRTEGRAALLTRQLQLRFGPLPESAQARLASASIEQLDAIGERLLSANTLEEVFSPV